MVATAMRLMQRDGYAATSWRDVVDAAEAPWGSAHHYFPGGKEQLAVEAVGLGASTTLDILTSCLAATSSPADAVRRWFGAAAAQLEASEFHRACPVATVALETASGVPALAAACSNAFESWIALLAAALTEAGVPAPTAAEVAAMVVLTLEGGLLLARVSHSVAQLQLAGRLAGDLVDSHLPLAEGVAAPVRKRAARPTDTRA